MAHNISSVSGRYEVWTAEKPAWHRLGEFTNERLTAAEAMQRSGTDFEILQRTLTLPDGTEAQGIRANVRLNPDGTDRVLAYVSPDFTIFQNREAWSLMEEIAGQSESVFTSAGAINDGRQIFIGCKLPGSHLVMKGHEIERYLLLSNGHGGVGPAMGGGRKLRIFFTPVNVVCNNTETAAISGQDNGITLTHVGDMTKRIAVATKTIAESESYFSGIAEVFVAMAGKKAVDISVRNYFKGLYPDLPATKARPKGVDRSDIRAALWASYNTAPGAGEALGTWWGAYNAISYFEDHLRWNRTRTRDDRVVSEIAFGSGARNKSMAFVAAAKSAGLTTATLASL